MSTYGTVVEKNIGIVFTYDGHPTGSKSLGKQIKYIIENNLTIEEIIKIRKNQCRKDGLTFRKGHDYWYLTEEEVEAMHNDLLKPNINGERISIDGEYKFLIEGDKAYYTAWSLEEGSWIEELI